MEQAESPGQRQLREVRDLTEWVRDQLYALDAGSRRSEATTALAAAAAEETFRLSDQLPQWQNATSAEWRAHLVRVWDYLAGDTTQHYPLSAAVADFLLSPLNHIEGQDGPDDFDRPQTVAAYSAALSVVVWGVDFAVTAIRQIFDCLDLKYDSDVPPEAEQEGTREIQWVRAVVSRIVEAEGPRGRRLDAGLLAQLRP